MGTDDGDSRPFHGAGRKIVISRLRAWGLRFTGLFGKERKDRELAEELESHLQMHVEDNLRAGMSPGEARRDALIKLGGLEQTKETYRERRSLPFVESMFQDLHFGLRMLRKSPGFTIAAVLTLALGIGANTAMFSVVNAVLIRSLPYGDADRLAYVWVQNRNFPQIPANAMGPMNADLFDIQRQAHSFSALTFFAQRRFNLATQGFAQRIGGALVPANFFATLEVQPELGRVIEADDDHPGRARVAVISHDLWQSQFGGDANILGQAVSLNGLSYQIVGVMPPGFLYPRDLRYESAPDSQVWLPDALTPQQIASREEDSADVVGRLRPGVSVEQAQAETSSILASVDALHLPELRGWYAVVQSFVQSALGEIRPQMLLLLGAASLVLLIACSNTANLLLARSADRTHEMGVRAALGAGRGRLARQMLTEAVLLACVGGILGVALARAAIPILVHFSPGNIPRLDQASLDRRVLLLSLTISLLTGLLFGVLPAAVASRVDLNALLKHAGAKGASRVSSRMRSSLVAIEVALAVVLLSSAVLLIRSFLKLQAVNTGFSETTLTMNLALDSRYAQPEQRRAFFESVVDRISQLPWAPTVGAAEILPLSNSESFTVLMVDGYPSKHEQIVGTRAVTGRYFEAMETPLIEGRFFSGADTPGGPFVLIVNQRFAQIYFAGQDPIGKRVRLGGRDEKLPWRSVVGVVADVRHSTLEEEAPAQVYVPFTQWNPTSAFIAVRSALPPAVMIPAVRNAARAVDPAVAVADIHTMDERVSEANSRRRFQTFLVTLFGGAALFLAAIGLYGVLSYSVRQRTPEIGVRLALGAQRGAVLRKIVGEGVRLALVGVCFGLLGALALRRVLSRSLFGVKPADPVTFVAVAVALLCVALAASYFPARRAATVDPMVALRHE